MTKICQPDLIFSPQLRLKFRSFLKPTYSQKDNISVFHVSQSNHDKAKELLTAISEREAIGNGRMAVWFIKANIYPSEDIDMYNEIEFLYKTSCCCM